MSLMLSGYIVSTNDLLFYAQNCGVVVRDIDALLSTINSWLEDQDGLPLLRRIQPQKHIILPTRAITGARFKFELEERDVAVKRAFLALCPDDTLRAQLDARMKFVTVPNPFGCAAAAAPSCDALPLARKMVPARTGQKRDWSEI